MIQLLVIVISGLVGYMSAELWGLYGLIVVTLVAPTLGIIGAKATLYDELQQ